MTTPTYTSPTTPTVTGAMPTPRTWHDLIDTWTVRLRAKPGLIRLGLDAAAVSLVVMAFARLVGSPEVLFHGVFVILTLHAFLFGLRGALLRTGLASIPLLAYASGIALGFDLEPLELTEWPLMFVIAVLVAWMADRRDSTANRYAALFREASERLVTVEEDERRRIARELHDNVGQVLTALTLTIDSAAAEHSDPPSGTARHLAQARHLSELALAETRHLAERLRPARLEEIGFIPALRDLAARAGFPVQIDASPDTLRPDLLVPSAIVEVYRIVQEALANAARHSGAGSARVVANVRGRALQIEIIDEGRGFDPLVAHLGVGLAGMRERADLLNASLLVRSTLGGGTRVTLSVPVQPERAG